MATEPLSLPVLPPELQEQILLSLPQCSDLAALSATSRRLHALVSHHGWDIFAALRFPARAAHDSPRALATAARNLERRGMRAFGIGPAAAESRQSMGYVSCVATDGDVVGVGAGAGVYVRSVGGGQWERYQREEMRDGRDDVTALVMGQGRTVYGTAGGAVRDLEGQEWHVGGRAVMDLALRRGMLVATTGGDTLSLFDLEDATDRPVSEMVIPGMGLKSARAWRVAWLNDSTVALSVSQTTEPIRLYTVRPTGISEQPTTRIAIHSAKKGSVYPIEPLHGTNGRVIASGGYDGCVRIHDLRCSERAAQYTASDVAEYGPVYSLLSRPGHHLMAGAAQFDLLSVMDLRTRSLRRARLDSIEDSGEAPTLLAPIDPEEETVQEGIRVSSNSSYDWRKSRAQNDWSGSYNLFLRERGARHQGPVYSLASPSPYSPYIFAGLENDVVQICLDGATDHTPDPAVRKVSETLTQERRSQPAHGRQRRDSQTRSCEIRLKSVEQASMKIMEQRAVADASDRDDSSGGLDEMWHPVRSEMTHRPLPRRRGNGRRT